MSTGEKKRQHTGDDGPNLSHFALRWNSHQAHVMSAFDSLLQNKALVDCTLVCEGFKIKAHKVVLSACSPYFEGIFVDNPCEHPVIVLNDVSHFEIQWLIDFMYKGCIYVPEEYLPSLMHTAHCLRIRGLTSTNSDGCDKITVDFEDSEGPVVKRIRRRTPSQPSVETKLDTVVEPHDAADDDSFSSSSSSYQMRRKQSRPRRRSEDNEEASPADADQPETAVLDSKQVNSHGQHSLVIDESDSSHSARNESYKESAPEAVPSCAINLTTRREQLASSTTPLARPHSISGADIRTLEMDNHPNLHHQPAADLADYASSHLFRPSSAIPALYEASSVMANATDVTDCRTVLNGVPETGIVQTESDARMEALQALNFMATGSGLHPQLMESITSRQCPPLPQFSHSPAIDNDKQLGGDVQPSSQAHEVVVPPPGAASRNFGPNTTPSAVHESLCVQSRRSAKVSPPNVSNRNLKVKGQHSAPRGGPPRAWTNDELTLALEAVWNNRLTTSQASRIFAIPYNSLLMYVRGKYGKSLKLDSLKVTTSAADDANLTTVGNSRNVSSRPVNKKRRQSDQHRSQTEESAMDVGLVEADPSRQINIDCSTSTVSTCSTSRPSISVSTPLDGHPIKAEFRTEESTQSIEVDDSSSFAAASRVRDLMSIQSRLGQSEESRDMNGADLSSQTVNPVEGQIHSSLHDNFVPLSSICTTNVGEISTSWPVDGVPTNSYYANMFDEHCPPGVVTNFHRMMIVNAVAHAAAANVSRQQATHE